MKQSSFTDPIYSRTVIVLFGSFAQVRTRTAHRQGQAGEGRTEAHRYAAPGHAGVRRIVQAAQADPRKAGGSVMAITVKKNEENPEPLELIAASVIKLADGIDKMRRSGLSQRAIKILLYDITKVPLNHIEKILNAGPALRGCMLYPEAK